MITHYKSFVKHLGIKGLLEVTHQRILIIRGKERDGLYLFRNNIPQGWHRVFSKNSYKEL